jgi:hypothetical protein
MVMSETDPILDSPDSQQNRPLLTLVLGTVVVIAICASAWFLFHTPSPNDATANEATIKIKMNSAETEYLANIHVKDIALSRAENFLHQEVTILSGTIVNSGAETVIALDLTILFVDQMDQIALRETRGILGSPALPLRPSQERKFDISFDRVPASWNMQQPTLHVAHLLLSPRK